MMASPSTSEPHSDPSFSGRLRAASTHIWDKVHRSPSRGSEGARGSVSQALGQAGVLSGAVGSPLIDPSHQQREDVCNGASVFLQELERVASRPTPPSGIQRKGTIELERDVGSVEEAHPITSVEVNPFEVKDDGASDKSYDFTENIRVIHVDAEHPMRALLDTGMRMNAIHLEKVERSGFPILTYTGPRLKDADGPDFDPLGKVDLQFYFKSYRSAKTWTLEFVVLRDPPFDVALGSAFIKHAGLLKRSDAVLPMAFGHQTEQQKREQDMRTREHDSQQAAIKADEKRKMDERRRIERERKEREREKKGRR